MGPARQTQLDGNRLRNVGQACSRSDRAGARSGSEGEDRNVLACVIETAERRIVAVVGGDHAKVGGPYGGFDRAEPLIESFETGSITRDVAAMAPFCVEI